MPDIMIKLNANTIQKLAIFEKITKSSLKDCLEYEDEINFILNSKNLGKAIGKNAKNIKKLENKFKKKVILIGFDNDPLIFAKNLLKPIDIKNIELKGKEMNITLIGNHRAFPIKKVKKAKTLLTKYFNTINNVIVKV